MRQLVLLSSALIAGASGIGAAQASRAQTAPATSTPSTNQGELLPDEQTQQVLNRLTFGPRPGDAEKVRAMGIDKWIDAQLHPERIADPAADSIISKYAIYAMRTSDIIHDYGIVQQLQKQVKRESAADSMDKRDA